MRSSALCECYCQLINWFNTISSSVMMYILYSKHATTVYMWDFVTILLRMLGSDGALWLRWTCWMRWMCTFLKITSLFIGIWYGSTYSLSRLLFSCCLCYSPFFVDKCLIQMGNKEFHCFFIIYALLAYSLCLFRLNCTTRMLTNMATCSVCMILFRQKIVLRYCVDWLCTCSFNSILLDRI